MSIYREGYHILSEITRLAQSVYNDAADTGAPVTPTSPMFNMVKQLIDWYRDEDYPITDEYGTRSCVVRLMDEWAVSDYRKTETEATERFRVDLTRITPKMKKHPSMNPAFKDPEVNAFVYVYRI